MEKGRILVLHFIMLCFYCWGKVWQITEEIIGVTSEKDVRAESPGGKGRYLCGSAVILRKPQEVVFNPCAQSRVAKPLQLPKGSF